MSVANIILEKNRGRLITDTVGYLGKEPAVLERKVRLLESPGVAMTVRGLQKLDWELEPVASACKSYDEVMSVLEEEILDYTPANSFQKSGSEVTVLGMVNGEVRCSRLLVTIRDGDISIQRVDLAPGVYLAPTLGQHSLPLSMTDEQVLKVAFLQQDIAVKHGLNICIGGDVEVATVDAAGMTVRKIGEYPNKAMTVARIAEIDASEFHDVAA